MTHERHQQVTSKAGALNHAVSFLMSALQRDLDVVHAHRQDVVEFREQRPEVENEAYDHIQRLNAQRNRLAQELDVLRDQVPTLKRMASGGARRGREESALIYIDQLAQAFLLAANDINARAKRLLSPDMIERLPAWEVESARASVAETERATAFLNQVLDQLS